MEKIKLKYLSKDDINTIFMESISTCQQQHSKISACRPFLLIFVIFLLDNLSYSDYEHMLSRLIQRYSVTEDNLKWFIDTIYQNIDDFKHVYNVKSFDYSNLIQYCTEHGYKALIQTDSFKALTGAC